MKHKFTWKHSDMSEKVELQSTVDDTSHTKQDDDTQGTSASTKAAAVTMSRWRKTSFTVMTLLAYMFLNAGISMITPFFAIVVSFRMISQGIGQTSSCAQDIIVLSFITITLGIGQAHVHKISLCSVSVRSPWA